MRVDAAVLTQPMHRGHPQWPAPWDVPAAARARLDGPERPAAAHQWDHPTRR
jgi:hypothetical protein